MPNNVTQQHRVTALPSEPSEGRVHRHLLSANEPIQKRHLCSLAQPSLNRPRHTPNFFFQEGSLLLIASGTLDLTCEDTALSISSSDSLLFVDAGTCANLVKTPGGREQRFRSIFLSFSPELLELFHRNRPSALPRSGSSCFQQVPLDDELESTLRFVYSSIEAPDLSEERLRYRLLDLLAGLAERGYHFQRNQTPGIAGRIRSLIAEAPDHRWTASAAGHSLAMSEATLRRRLASEQSRFEDLLVDVRMHHALMLIQTTGWSISRISEACGYKSRARFAERFRQRFGYLPSKIG